jgi:hypothetical protein
MKKFTLSILVALTLCAATAVAQARGAQGTQGSSPSMGSPNTQQQPGTAQPGMGSDQTSPTAQTDQNTANNHEEKGEKTMKGCIQSQNGQYVLETKKGNIPLTGQDVSAHVGHEVKVKGTWEKGSTAGMAGSTESSTAGSASHGMFNVSNVDMVSENCKIKTKSNSGNMGSTTNPPNPNPAYGSSNGTGAGAANGTSNQPQ